MKKMWIGIVAMAMLLSGAIGYAASFGKKIDISQTGPDAWTISTPKENLGIDGDYANVARLVDYQHGTVCYIVMTLNYAPVISCVPGRQ